MALIKCPECSKENVSDSAPTCPECGFAIREHFDNIKNAKIAQEQEIEKKKQAEQKRQREIENKKQQEQQRINSITKPEKPKFSKGYGICGAISALGGAIYLSISEPFSGWFLIICAFGLLGTGAYFYSTKLSEYNLAASNFEEYRKQKIEEQNIANANAKRNRAIHEAAAKNAPKCPSCQSTNVKSISTTSRVVSVGMVGLASSKIGKTMECKNCGYKW